MRAAIALMVAACLVTTAVPAPAQEPDDLQAGIRQVQGGEFEAAVITLDAAARRLAAAGNRPRELARADVYLAIAYLELGQAQAARTKAIEAMSADRDLRLDAKEFPPKIIRFFDQVRADNPAPPANRAAPPAKEPPPSPAPSPRAPAARPSASAPATGGGHSKALLIVLGAGAAAAGLAVAASHGGGPASTATTVPVASLGSLSATLTTPQLNANLNCTQSVFVTVTLTNHAGASVSVTGVRDDSHAVAGGCTGTSSVTLNPAVTTVGGNQTATVLNRSISPSSGVGCCNAGSPCDGRTFCQFAETLTVLTSVGEVTAGAFGYGIRFQGCTVCSSSAAAAKANCSPPLPER